jgi:hypothetical protein
MSCHPMEYKMAAFHSILYRACILPLSRENFEKEVVYIKETAGLNGYTDTTIDGLMSKHLFKRKIKEVSTLSLISKEVTTKRAGLTFHPGLSKKISNIMAKHDIQMVPKASGKLSQVLWSPVDVLNERAKSCIYAVPNMPGVYYGRDEALTNESRSIISMVRTWA